MSTCRDDRLVELELLDRVLAGDANAWTDFCARYDRLIRCCARKVLVRYRAEYCADDVDDLTGEIWLALLRDDNRKLRLFDRERGYRVGTWIGLIATNHTIDFLRCRKANISLDDLAQPERFTACEATPHTLAAEREASTLARRALEQLAPADREFVTACFHDERPPAELARELGVSLNTVYSRKFKIRSKLVDIVSALTRAPLEASAAA